MKIHASRNVPYRAGRNKLILDAGPAGEKPPKLIIKKLIIKRITEVIIFLDMPSAETRGNLLSRNLVISFSRILDMQRARGNICIKKLIISLDASS